ncbi:MAG: sodium:proton antiporter [Telmatospirillum sp.]|nr:sodium:proton antiporter [Telmatospirillum sp.]
MDMILARTVGLLVVAMLVAIGARRCRLPYTVGLVLCGFFLALMRVDAGPSLTHSLIFLVILPPLLFEAAFNLKWAELRPDLKVVACLTMAGVVISAGVVAAGMVAIADWPLRSAVVFGVLIAATDPVAVIAMFKDNRFTGRLRLLVESESLFNDGVAAVLFALALTWAQGHEITALSLFRGVALSAGGGIAIGLFCGAVAIVLAGRITDNLVETTLSVAAAYGSFLLAERVHASGVMATVAAGMLMGNLTMGENGPTAWLSESSRDFLANVWNFAAFIANSLVFLMIGLALAGLPFGGRSSLTIGIAILLGLLGRLLSVYPLCLPFRNGPAAVPAREQHVLWGGGLRGALGLALALSLPHSLPGRDEIVTTTFGVAAFSIVVQGLSMPGLLRRLGFLGART